MTKFKTYLSGLFFMGLAALTVSCDNNDEIKVDPNAQFDVILNVDEAGPANPNKDVVVNANTQTTIKAKVNFKSTTNMKRLYITKNIEGQGEEKFEPTESVDLKGDGSLDLTGKNENDFEYQFNLPVPSGVDDGTVVYKFWVTSGIGDFRDVTKRLVGTAGTITLKYGTASNPAANVKSFTNVKLFTPTADAMSMSFFSLLDGTIYKIEQGEEYIKFWDFGYINLTEGGPALHSTFSYPTIAIPSLEGTVETKNKVYFKNSTKTATDFAAVSISADLDFITMPSETFVGSLETGDIVEFVDGYGKKGMLKVTEAMVGNESNKYIKFDLKVQP